MSPSRILELTELSIIAEVDELVVVIWPIVISSSADAVIVPELLLKTVPSTMVKAPPDSASEVASSSAETVIFPLAVVKSPAAVKITSSSADNVIAPALVVKAA